MKFKLVFIALYFLEIIQAFQLRSYSQKKPLFSKSYSRFKQIFRKQSIINQQYPDDKMELINRPQNYELLNPLENHSVHQIKANDQNAYYDQQELDLQSVKKGETILVGNMSAIQDSDFDKTRQYKKLYHPYEHNRHHLPINQKDQKPYYNPMNESTFIHTNNADNIFHVPIESEREHLKEAQSEENKLQQLVNREQRYYYDGSHLQRPEDFNLTSLEKTLEEQKKQDAKEKILGKPQKLSEWENDQEEKKKNIRSTLGYKDAKFNIRRQQHLMNNMKHAEYINQQNDRKNNKGSIYYKESNLIKSNDQLPYYDANEK